MFEFLKRKKSPRPIFGALGTDMHCHLIPRVDDGSKSMEESLSCLQSIVDVGYRKVFVTPHFQPPRFPNKEEDIKNLFEELKKAAAEANIPIELVGVGGEYRLDEGFIEATAQTNYLTVGEPSVFDKGYLLTELSLQNHRRGFVDEIAELQKRDYVVILAHPERYPYLNVRGHELADLKDMGVLLQVNLLSLDGFYGPLAQRRAEDLIDAGIVELLGTDCHNVLYAQALENASRNRKIEKIIEKNSFLNTEL